MALASTLQCGARCAVAVRAAGRDELPRCHLRLLVNVGSLCEAEEEMGAAHFIEHLAFRGTKSFSHGELIKLVELTGSKFGNDLNAKTSPTHTVYQLDLPLQFITMGLCVLCEWAFHIRVSDDDVEIERGVIIEEIRLKQGASARVKHDFWQVALPLIARRPPSGSVDFVSSVQPGTLRKFYAQHYQPRNMAVVVCIETGTGESPTLTAHALMRLVNENFTPELSGLSVANPNLLPAKYPPCTFADLVGHDAKVRFVCASDKDLSARSVSLELLQPVTPSADESFVLRDLLRRVLSSCLDQRFKLLSRKHASTMLRGGVSFGLVLHAPVVELSSVRIELVGKRGAKGEGADYAGVLEVLVTELRSLYAHGVDMREVDRALRNWTRFFDARQHEACSADELVDHFMLDGRTLLFESADEEASLMKRLLANVRVADVSNYAREWLQPLIHDGKDEASLSGLVVVAVQGPDRLDGVELALRDALNSALRAPLSPPAIASEASQQRIALEKTSVSDLRELVFPMLSSNHLQIAQEETLVQKEFMRKSQAIVYSLGGHRVCVCRRPPKPSGTGKISVQGFSLGGASELGNDSFSDACLLLAPEAVKESGIGLLSGPDLEAVEDRWSARVHLQRHLLHRGVGGSCDAVPGSLDLLTAMLGSRLCGFHRVDQAVFDRLLHRYEQPTEGVDVQASQVIRSFAYGEDELLLRPVPPNVWTSPKVSRAAVEAIANAAFSCRSGPWTLVFVGPVPENDAWATSLLVHMHACSLASTSSAPWLSPGSLPRQLAISKAPNKKVLASVGSSSSSSSSSSEDSDKASVILCMAANVVNRNDVEDVLRLQVAADLVRTRLLARMRTEQASVYTVSVDVSRSSLSCFARVFIAFSASVADAALQKDKALGLLGELSREGPMPDEVQALTTATTMALKAKVTDGHVLFRLLDAFKARPAEAIENVDDLASPDWDRLVESAVSGVRLTVENLTATCGTLELYPPERSKA